MLTTTRNRVFLFELEANMGPKWKSAYVLPTLRAQHHHFSEGLSDADRGAALVLKRHVSSEHQNS
jgi:hypothetical protein